MPVTKVNTRPAGSAKRSEARRVFQALDRFCADLQPGDKVPTHTELMRRFGASERMILRALDEMHKAGRIVRRIGTGTFITDDGPPLHDPLVTSTTDSRTIIVVARASDSFSSRSLELLIQQAEPTGLPLVCRLLTSDYRSGPLPTVLPPAELSGPRGFVVLGSDLAPVAQYLRDSGHRVVLFGTPEVDAPVDVPCIHGDHEQGAYLATQHLIALGHRRIAFVHASSDVRHSYRWRGHQDALAEARAAGTLVADTLLTHETYDAWLADDREAAAYFRRPDAPTGLVVWNDSEAVMFLTVLLSAGLRVPRDVSLVGYDNLPEGRRVHPPLTTVDHGVERQMRLALKMITQVEIPITSQVLVTPTLIARASSASPPSEPGTALREINAGAIPS